MKYIHAITPLILGLSLWLLPSVSLGAPPETLPILSKESRENHFKKISLAFKKRWHKFSKRKNFVMWTYGRAHEDLLREYSVLDTKRRSTWFEAPYADFLVAKPDYEVAQKILSKGLYRNLNTIGFEYNTDEYFNASTIIIGKHRFLALEAPKEEQIPIFFNLLLNKHVTQLIRLTPEFEGKKATSAPYWLKRTVENDGQLYISIPQSTQGTGIPYKIPYYVIDNWMDDTSPDKIPNQLFHFVMNLKSSIELDKENLIAVHCHSGVSRTGTVIAVYVLFRDIDEQVAAGVNPKNIKISVEKTVLQLSLQRPHAVGKPLQYEIIYKVVDLYIDYLIKNKTNSI